jgi:transaldolase / glucose-6-phosphate isomerase
MDARARLTDMHAIERLARCDATLFVDPVTAAGRLGWVGLAAEATARAADYEALGAEALAGGTTDVVLLGMGGSSLAPLVLARAIGGREGCPTLHVLDTTGPSEVASLLETLSPASTLVIVASKSGTTIEPLTLLCVLRAWMTASLGDAAPSHFIAITDPGSPLAALAAEAGFAHTILAPPEVGGRYAALTPFGMVPAALIGIDVAFLAATAVAFEEACAREGEDNPAAALATWMTDSYEAGRDKLDVVCSPDLESFGLWVEQLVAESTGKGGRGLLPVLEPAPGSPASHGEDRMTFVLRSSDDADLAGLAARLPAGEPVFEVVIDDPYALGAEFVHWEWAVALFSSLSRIDPFDQPDVERSKVATRAILRKEAVQPPHPSLPGRAHMTGSPGIPTGELDEAVAALVAGVAEGGYLAVLAYLREDDEALARLRDACSGVARALRVPVTLELGPRYLHSTGQYHKGGPAHGSFLVLAVTDETDIPVPGEAYGLAELHAAQPAGDVAALLSSGRRVLSVVLPSLAGVADVAGALARAARV